jgi:hypothetical protein
MNTRKAAVIVGTSVLAAGAAVGVAAQGETTPSSSSNRPQMMRGGDPLAALADELGVSETRLREAMDSLRQSGRPQDPAAALAAELGVSEAEVRDALESSMPQGGPGGAAAPPDGSDQAEPQDGRTQQSSAGSANFGIEGGEIGRREGPVSS